ncbi:MAG: heavy metal translocating P-type ATPase, partial [Bacteroidia bacterium]|nr:heavy metal translocating P-type ATPase [Bacteroidia bacterium]
MFEILSENNLCEYYSLDDRAGLQQKEVVPEAYAYLDEPAIRAKVIEFENENFCRVRFNVPAIHCVSCIWLLENLQKLHNGILKSEVNFGRKKVVVDFKTDALKLSELAAVLASVGYAPQIRLETSEKQEPSALNKTLLLKLAVAGFCFGNVMLFSFPEYFGLTRQDHGLDRLFAWLNVALSVPPLLYSGSGYLVSAWKSFRQRQVNIDVPIAVGLVALWARSLCDITLQAGPGYLDSFTGLIFFLLIGRWFQDKTYESLTFDRDFKAYFPLAVSAFRHGVWKPVVVFELEPEDTIRVRNME